MLLTTVGINRPADFGMETGHGSANTFGNLIGLRIFQGLIGTAQGNHRHLFFEHFGFAELQAEIIGDGLADRITRNRETATPNLFTLGKDHAGGFSAHVQNHGATFSIWIGIAVRIVNRGHRHIHQLGFESTTVHGFSQIFHNLLFHRSQQHIHVPFPSGQDLTVPYHLTQVGNILLGFVLHHL